MFGGGALRGKLQAYAVCQVEGVVRQMLQDQMPRTAVARSQRVRWEPSPLRAEPTGWELQRVSTTSYTVEATEWRWPSPIEDAK